MSAAVLTIGTELTRGELVNSNSQVLAELLTEHGYEVTELCTVDDDDERIVKTLQRLGDSHALVLSTGGLGPTTDDRTSACAAAALGVPLKRDEATLLHLKELFSRYNRPMSPSNAQQADFPEGATILPNDHGTARGFHIRLGQADMYFFPGVPSEMRPMAELALATKTASTDPSVVCLRLKVFNLPESEVNDRLKGIEQEHNVTIGYRASHAEIEVKVLASNLPPSFDAQTRAEQAFDLVKQRLGAFVYGEGKTSLPEVLGGLLRSLGLTLGLAESCTGGLVSQLITSVPGASQFYAGGVCSYENRLKEKLLHVSPQTLERYGAVSSETALEMAEGACRALSVDVALSLTGIAGPDGGTPEKPVGLVHFAVSRDGRTRCDSKVFRGDREQVRKRAALHGLWLLREFLLNEAEAIEG